VKEDLGRKTPKMRCLCQNNKDKHYLSYWGIGVKRKVCEVKPQLLQLPNANCQFEGWNKQSAIGNCQLAIFQYCQFTFTNPVPLVGTVY
jgi:hypothetical protein